MWTFKISSGAITTPAGTGLGRGHSGWGDAANDPKRVKEKMVGPIPPGKYKIGMAYKHDKLGPVCMNLDPLAGTDTFGRSLFRIHGDNSTPDKYDASHGCIILARAFREAINFSEDKVLHVIE